MGMLERLLCRPLNHVLIQSEWAPERLKPFTGAQLRMAVGALCIDLVINAAGTFEVGDAARPADVTVTLPADTFVLLVTDRARVFPSAKLSGSADLAEALGFVFRNLSWDAEADLAQLIGDVPAHRLERLRQSVFAQTQQAFQRTADNVSEYLREETALLVRQDEVVQFNDAVSVLRDDLARLEKRLSRL